jgi:carboxylate-amine ligase
MPAGHVLEALLDHVGAVLALNGDSAVAVDGIARVLARGTGSQRQTAVWRRTGDVTQVVADAALATVADDARHAALRPSGSGGAASPAAV